jgi:YD repeat-containing protein
MSPNQPTNYGYDVLNNLVSVNQANQTRSFTYDSLSRLVSSQNPESGIVTSTFDANGNLITQRDARGLKTIYDYDVLGRVMKKCFRIIGTGSLGATSCSQAGSELEGSNETRRKSLLEWRL